MVPDQTQVVYARAQLGQRLILGTRPAIVVVDFSRGFTDPACPLGAELSHEVEATRLLLDAARAFGLPIIFTTVGYESHLKDLGLWALKSPAMKALLVGSEWVAIDPRLAPRPDEIILLKKGASAFFGTQLSALLQTAGVDTVILCGATTSGCVRATAIDLLQYGFPSIVPRECVGDRAIAPHEANLIDIDAKYADVVSLAEALEYLRGLRTDILPGADSNSAPQSLSS